MLSPVRPSVTRVDQSRTVERIIELLSPSDRPNILVFRHQRSLRKSDCCTPNGGAKYKGVAKTSNFRPICCYISERVLDKGIVTMEDEYKVLCAVSISATFDDLEWPRTSVSRSQCSLKVNISQTVHPIHSMFGPRLGFSGSAIDCAICGSIKSKMAADGHLGHTKMATTSQPLCQSTLCAFIHALLSRA